MNKMQEYFWFDRPDRQFLERSYALHDLSDRLNGLNERRKLLQREYKLIKQSSNCADCKGKCCTGKFAPYYSVIDSLLRMFSDQPVPEIYWWKPRPLGQVLRERMHLRGGTPAGQSAEEQTAWCSSLGPQGCVLAAEDRPMRCILYICSEARRTLPAEALQKMGAINRELNAISAEVLRCFGRRRRFLF